MSIFVKEVNSPHMEEGSAELTHVPLMYVMVEGVEDVAAFKKLIQQGSNLEPNISPAMKELADLVTVGKIQQPYRSRSE